MKRPEENFCKSHFWQRSFLSEYMKNNTEKLKNNTILKTKQVNPVLKQEKNVNRHFTKEDIWVD